MANGSWLIDGQESPALTGADIQWEDERFFTLTYQGQHFHGEIVEERMEDRELVVKINHRVFHLRKKGSLDALIAEMGLDKPKVRQLKELEAPMPGRIVSVAVEIGQEILPGDEVLSLEAMKMENVLKAEGTGKVKEILVTTNDVVDKGAVLISFE